MTAKPVTATPESADQVPAQRGAQPAAKLVPFPAAGFAPRFAYGDQAQVVEISGTSLGTPLGTGFARLARADIPWTVRYDEVLLVLEGTVTVRTAAGDLTARPHDCIWLPAGTELSYIAEDALVFYAMHPANWAEAS
ncbi:MAG: ethanolamine utilization protein EutQ [Pseudomonadota bacterium]